MYKQCLLFLQKGSARKWRTIRGPIGKGGVLAGSLLAILLWLCQPVQAQLPTVDDQLLFLDQFPAIRVRLLCNDPAIVDPAPAFRVSEDGVLQTIISATATVVQRPRTQTAIFIDLFDDQKKFAGDVGAALNHLYELYETSVFTIATDELAVYAPAIDAHTNQVAKLAATAALTTPLDVVVDWTGNVGVLVPDVYTITFGATERPFAKFKSTPLLDLLLETLTRFDLHSLRRQNLLVFSDGTEPTNSSKAQRDDVVDAAKTRGITIHTFWLDTGFDGQENLEALATETGGQFTVLSAKLVADQEWWRRQFWPRLLAPNRICDLTYRTSKPGPQFLFIYPPLTATLATQPIAVPLLTAPVQPPVLQVQLLRQDTQMFVQPAVTNSITAATTLDLLLNWNFAGAPPRHLRAIQYTISGAQVAIAGAIEPPPAPTQALHYSIPLTNAPPGVPVIYNLSVKIIDELDLADQESRPFGLVAPTATPTPSPTATPLPTPTTAPSPTPPTPTATPLLVPRIFATVVTGVDQGRVATSNWFAADRPFRALLVSSLLLFVALAGLVYWLWQKRLKQLQEELEPMVETTPARIYAILYRTQDHPDLTLQQVVKLDEKNADLPEKLYTSQTAGQEANQTKSERLSIFKLFIAWRDRRYRLEKRKDGREVLVRRGNETITVASDLTLQNNDQIKLGQTNYAFYELDASAPSSAAPSAGSTMPGVSDTNSM